MKKKIFITVLIITAVLLITGCAFGGGDPTHGYTSGGGTFGMHFFGGKGFDIDYNGRALAPIVAVLGVIQLILGKIFNVKFTFLWGILSLVVALLA